MGLSSRPYAPRGYSSGYFPPGVKWLLITNTAIFVAHFLAARAGLSTLFDWAALVPAQALGSFKIWQLATYLFLHGDIWHVLINMLTLYMFGADLERQWGTDRFLRYYFLCGIGAGICVVIVNYAIGGRGIHIPTIGASGAIYGLLMAFGILYPDRQILFSFLFPIPAKYFVMILGGIAFLSTFAASGSGVSHVAHLGGMLFGYVYLKSGSHRSRVRIFQDMGDWYQNWKIQRAKRKFEVYMRKQRDRDR